MVTAARRRVARQAVTGDPVSRNLVHHFTRVLVRSGTMSEQTDYIIRCLQDLIAELEEDDDRESRRAAYKLTCVIEELSNDQQGTA